MSGVQRTTETRTLRLKVQKRQKGQAHSKSFADAAAEFFFRQSSFGSGFSPLPWGDQGHVPSSMKPAEEGSPKTEARKGVESSKLSVEGSIPEAADLKRSDVFSRLAAALTTN